MHGIAQIIRFSDHQLCLLSFRLLFPVFLLFRYSSGSGSTSTPESQRIESRQMIRSPSSKRPYSLKGEPNKDSGSKFAGTTSGVGERNIFSITKPATFCNHSDTETCKNCNVQVGHFYSWPVYIHDYFSAFTTLLSIQEIAMELKVSRWVQNGEPLEVKWIVLSTWFRKWQLMEDVKWMWYTEWMRGYRAWGALKSVLSNRGFGIKAKECLYELVIVPTALYGAETMGYEKCREKENEYS